MPGPLLIVSEGIRGGIARPAVGISETDVVYSRSFYGMSFSGLQVDLAYRLGGVLMSAVTAWHLLLTGSEFGIHKRKVLRQDLIGLPTPSLEVLSSSDAAPVSSAMNALMEGNGYSEKALSELDEAVFDLFGLDEHERLVVLGGGGAGQTRIQEPAYGGRSMGERAASAWVCGSVPERSQSLAVGAGEAGVRSGDSRPAVGGSTADDPVCEWGRRGCLA